MNEYKIIKSLSFIFLLSISVLLNDLHAEEQCDLYEGITSEVPEKSKWGFLPRIKMNPDTGIGTGIKLKGANVFGLPVFLDIANIITHTYYQIYELATTIPRIGKCNNYWYFTAYGEFYLVPDMRFFGIGNNTKNHMSDEKDNKVGNESVHKYKNIVSRLIFGRSFNKVYFFALQPYFKRVWISKSKKKNLPQTVDVYSGIKGTEGGIAPGIGFCLIRSTRNDQWKAGSGSRIELGVTNSGPYFGSDYKYTGIIFDARKYINLFGEYNVLALHVRAESIINKYDETPWWELPYVGGRNTLRGYWEGRFRGRRIVYLNCEYRFPLFSINLKLLGLHLIYNFDGNFFFDTGRAFTPDDDLNDTPHKDWKYSGGTGIRLITPPNLMGRLDIGFSKEMKPAVYFNFGTVF